MGTRDPFDDKLVEARSGGPERLAKDVVEAVAHCSDPRLSTWEFRRPGRRTR